MKLLHGLLRWPVNVEATIPGVTRVANRAALREYNSNDGFCGALVTIDVVFKAESQMPDWDGIPKFEFRGYRQ